MLGDLWRSSIFCCKRQAPPWDCHGGLVNSSLFKERQGWKNGGKKYYIILQAMIHKQTQENGVMREKLQGKQGGELLC
jgi:hypothetical protein